MPKNPMTTEQAINLINEIKRKIAIVEAALIGKRVIDVDIIESIRDRLAELDWRDK